MQSLKSRLVYCVLKRRLAQFRQLNLPLPAARALRDEEAGRRFFMPAGVVSESADMAGVAGEWLHPHGQRTTSIVLYLHGGAYVQGSVKTHRALAARLALASASSVLIIDYRLAPEHPYPAALDDAHAVYQALLAGQESGYGRFALAGDSAGGGLALALALRIKADGVLPPPAALALLSPWTDLTLGNASHATNAAVDPYFPTTAPLRAAAAGYSGGTELTNPFISAQFADLAGLPSTLIHVGEKESLLDDSRVLALNMRAKETQVELKIYPGMWHVWQIFGGQLREADQSLLELGRFLRAALLDQGQGRH